MAVSGPVASIGVSYEKQMIVVPSDPPAGWQTAIDVGGLSILDGAPITNPTTQITDSTRIEINRENKSGAVLLVRLCYPTAAVQTTPAIVQVAGRTGNQPWELLKTRGLAERSTLSISATDFTDGTIRRTTVDYNTTAFLLLGCTRFLVGVSQVPVFSVGSVASAYVELKIL